VVTDSASSQKIPSVDLEIEQAADDAVRDPVVYSVRVLREQEAKERMEQKLRSMSMRRRCRVRASLAKLSHG
jgi:hypothetical protein